MSQRPFEWSPWGLLATTLILAALLASTGWLNHQQALRAADQLARTQADFLENSIQQQLAVIREPPSKLHLKDIFLRHSDRGLLYFAVLDHRGIEVVATGKQAPASAASRERSDPQERETWTRLGDSYSLLVPLSTKVAEGNSITGNLKTGNLETGSSEIKLQQFLLINLRAENAQTLTRQTTRIFTIGMIGAFILPLVGFGFWRKSRDREQNKEVLEKERRLSASGVMSAVLAHEIRNPLASLKGHSQLLAEQVPESHPAGGKVRRIVSEATRLEKLTTDLLSFAKSGALDRQLIDPVALMEDCIQETGYQQVSIDSRSAPALWSLDGPRFYQVLSNLLHNALQASPADASVEVGISVEATSQSSELRISIRDHGEGIPTGQEDEIFEPFVTTRTRGTGLGLAVARRIVSLHGGTLIGRNHPAGGAEFQLCIPPAPSSSNKP